MLFYLKFLFLALLISATQASKSSSVYPHLYPNRKVKLVSGKSIHYNVLCLYLRQSFLLKQGCKGQKVVSCHYSSFLFFCGEVKNVCVKTSVKFLSYIHSPDALLGLYLLAHIDTELLFLRGERELACDFLILSDILSFFL